MPAVTLQNRTTHTSQNWGVLIAFAAETLSVVMRGLDFSWEGSKPSGFQPSAGTLMVNAPNIM